MKRPSLSRLGLMLGFAALLGGAPAFADAPAIACPPVKHHVAVHHHRWGHRYIARPIYRQAWGRVCGSIDHPCNIDHLTIPVQ